MGSTQKTIQRVTVLLLPESSLMTLASVLDPLRAANRLSRTPLFSWEIRSFSGEPAPLTCGIDIPVTGPFTSADTGDSLIVIAGFNHERYVSKQSLQILRQAKPKFNLIAAVEAGTWVLARAGLITHHCVTTHWEDTENLSDAYPRLDVRKDRYVVDGNIWSSGGASPALDMMLHYLRTTQNKSLALDVASVFIYAETHAPSQTQPVISLGRVESVEPRLATVIRRMEAHLEDPLSIQELATNIHLSVRMLERLSQKHLGTTPGAYYLRLRLQAARRLVLDTNLSILDISIRAGFNSQTAFSRAFRHRYGLSAQRLRKLSV